jgi:hypothetical protein
MPGAAACKHPGRPTLSATNRPASTVVSVRLTRQRLGSSDLDCCNRFFEPETRWIGRFVREGGTVRKNGRFLGPTWTELPGLEKGRSRCPWSIGRPALSVSTNPVAPVGPIFARERKSPARRRGNGGAKKSLVGARGRAHSRPRLHPTLSSAGLGLRQDPCRCPACRWTSWCRRDRF